MIKPEELRKVYYPYHSLDPAQAIERIIEANGLGKRIISRRAWRCCGTFCGEMGKRERTSRKDMDYMCEEKIKEVVTKLAKEAKKIYGTSLYDVIVWFLCTGRLCRG